MTRNEFSQRISPKECVPCVKLFNITGRWETLTMTRGHFVLYEQSAKMILLRTKTVNAEKLTKVDVSPYILNFDHLRRSHHPDNEYKLIPIVAANVHTFEAMDRITQLPGCPFSMNDRVDPSSINIKFTYRSPVRAAAAKILPKSVSSYKSGGSVVSKMPILEDDVALEYDLPVQGIFLSGAFLVPKVAVAFVFERPQVDVKSVDQVKYTAALLFDPAFRVDAALTDSIYEMLPATKQRFFFLVKSGRSSLTKGEIAKLQAAAQPLNISLLHRDSQGIFQYCS